MRHSETLLRFLIYLSEPYHSFTNFFESLVPNDEHACRFHKVHRNWARRWDDMCGPRRSISAMASVLFQLPHSTSEAGSLKAFWRDVKLLAACVCQCASANKYERTELVAAGSEVRLTTASFAMLLPIGFGFTNGITSMVSLFSVAAIKCFANRPTHPCNAGTLGV